MTLTPEQKAAGRYFRGWCRGWLDGLEAGAACPPFTVWYRHECKPGDRAVQSGTWAMYLRQHYWTSPEMPGAPAGLFAFIFRRGECSRCGLAVRSGSGRFVIAAENPPEKGAVVAQQSANREVPAG